MKKLLSIVMFMFVSLCLGVIGFTVYAKNDMNPNNNINANNNIKNTEQLKNIFENNNNNGFIIRQIKTKFKEQNNTVKNQASYKLNVLFDELKDVTSVDEIMSFDILSSSGSAENTINIVGFK